MSIHPILLLSVFTVMLIGFNFAYATGSDIVLDEKPQKTSSKYYSHIESLVAKTMNEDLTQEEVNKINLEIDKLIQL